MSRGTFFKGDGEEHDRMDGGKWKAESRGFLRGHAWIYQGSTWKIKACAGGSMKYATVLQMFCFVQHRYKRP